MKKNLGVLSFLTLMSMSLVSAGPVQGLEQLLRGLNDAIVVVIEFVSRVLWDIETYDEFLLAKLLLLIIIYLVIYTIFKKNKFLGEDKKIIMIIAGAISILSIRFIPDNFIEAILLQYSTLGIALATFLPLMIFFFFIHQSNIGNFGRRAGWFLYGAILIVLWSMRGDELGEANWIYLLGLIFVLVSLFFDNSIHRYLGLSDYRRHRRSIERRNRNTDLIRLEQLRGIVNPTADVIREIDEIERRLRRSF